MGIAVVADAHLGGPGGSAEPLAAQLLKLPAQGCERLLLLGDIFQVWVGFERFATREILVLMEALTELQAGGLPIHYVEGNRDFFIAGSAYERVFATVGKEARFVAGGHRCLAVHGDDVNRADYPYRVWRFLSKNAMSRLAMRHLPHKLASRLIYGVEGELAKSNFKHKRKIPDDLIRDYGIRRLAEGHRVVLMGHFHAPRRWQVDGGEVLVIDAWYNSRQIDWLTVPAEGRR